LLLGPGQSIRKAGPLDSHLGQDIIRRSVDNRMHGINAIGRKSFAKRLNTRNPAAHACLKAKPAFLPVCKFKYLIAIFRKESLVRRHNMFAVLQGFLDQFAGHSRAADQLHDHIDGRIPHHGKSVLGHKAWGRMNLPPGIRIFLRNPLELKGNAELSLK